jgi:hypothetical protein
MSEKLNIKELTLEEVSEIVGISEATLLKNWKRCEPRAKELGITKEGKGKKAQYFQTIDEDPNKIAYDILREYLINECGFDTRTDFKKLAKYIYLVLLNTVDSKRYRNAKYMEEVDIAEKNLINYRRKLTQCGVMKPKHICKGTYAYMDMDNIYNLCDEELHDSFTRSIISMAEKLLEESYNIDLTNFEDYQKAKDIITSDFDVSDLMDKLLSVSDNGVRKDILKDQTTNNTLKIDKESILRLYKIAFFEVSKQWQEVFKIKHVKFFPNHMLVNSIAKDNTFIEMIVNAYAYTLNN